MDDLISKNASRLELCMRLMDVIALYIGGNIAARLCFRMPLQEADSIHTVLLYFCCGLAFFLFLRLDVYMSRRGRSTPELLVRLGTAWVVVLLIGLVFSFLIRQVGSLSRLWMFCWFCSGLTLLICSRAIAYSTLDYLRKKGINTKRVMIVGYGATGHEMHRRALQRDWFGYDVVAILASHEDAFSVNEPTIHNISSAKDIPAYVAANAIDEIWITLPMSASTELRQLQYLLRNALADIRWMPDTSGMQILSNRMVYFLGFPAIELNRPVSSDLNGLAKDIFDKVFALAALVLLAPLFCIIGMCVKLSSPGPVFFRQPRLGLNGRTFHVYKFRSMRVHEEQNTVTQACRDDPRVLRVGHFLRRTSLDELPQFINVLKGDMSVVGPRPHALQHNEMYKDLLESYMLRHRVKPGITGWAQIHGYRGETDTVDKMADRVKFDLHYIQHWSFWMDVRIIVWTAFKGWTGKNAY
jgi:putative colanic acid biosynthesis UDP-glucose lipid carrier transferase